MAAYVGDGLIAVLKLAVELEVVLKAGPGVKPIAIRSLPPISGGGRNCSGA